MVIFFCQYTVNIGLSLGVVVDLMIAAFLIYELTQTQTTIRFVASYDSVEGLRAHVFLLDPRCTTCRRS